MNPAFFFAPEEMKTRGYGEEDIPSLVKGPHLYILGRCGSKEAVLVCDVNSSNHFAVIGKLQGKLAGV